MSEEKTFKYEFNVAMSCGGCSGAIDRVLKKLEGVKEYEVSLEKQNVLVEPTDPEELSYKDVLEKISKTGKTVKGGFEDGKKQSIVIEDGKLVPLDPEEQAEEQAEEDKKDGESKPAESEEQAVDSKKDGKEQ